MRHKQWLIQPVQDPFLQYMGTFVEYPPLQEAAAIDLGALIERLRQGMQ